MGKHIVWTDELIAAEALKYALRSDFRIGSIAAYRAASKRGILDSVCSHIPSRTRWTKNLVFSEALKYKTRVSFQKGSHSAYNAGLRMGILDEACSHMNSGLGKEVRWTKDYILAIAETCESWSDFVLRYPGGQKAAKRHGLTVLLKESLGTTRHEWTFAKLQSEADKYDGRGAFSEGSPGAYLWAKRRNLLDEICKNYQQKGWDNKSVIGSAISYESRSEWHKKSPGAVVYAKRNGLYEVCCAHMVEKVKPSNYWTIARLKEAALKFSTKEDFRRGNCPAWAAAHRSGKWVEITAHMGSAWRTDADTIYVWRAEDQFFNRKPVYKIGVTSIKCGDSRISQVCRASGFKPCSVIKTFVGVGRAYEVEKAALNFGCDPKFSKFDGSTEFRALSDQQLSEVLSVISSCNPT